MVKLRITARVIPEDAYLTSIESSSVQNSMIRGEKRFYVVVREPEMWYIGTLALEIKKRYESLYKHDLGQIKYLKDNADDCDLDPELYVSDALVDEGRVLTDPSDQHVTIKVIQEEGRAVRQGSVVPDLSQTHYRLPERPVRPPVPTFQEAGSTLGKRKAGSDKQDLNVQKKRTRLDEIEEDEPIASIEGHQPTQLGVVVEDSQSMPMSPPAVRSPELTWSFSRIGPPTAIPATSQSQQIGPEHDQHQNISTDHNQERRSLQSQVRDKTPNTRLRDLKSPRTGGLRSMSPLAATSSSSKKFLKPRREVYAFPESDIDDSQMSPASRDTSRITPRLVPSGRLNGGVNDSVKEGTIAHAHSMPGTVLKKAALDTQSIDRSQEVVGVALTDKVSGLDNDKSKAGIQKAIVPGAESENQRGNNMTQEAADKVANGMSTDSMASERDNPNIGDNSEVPQKLSEKDNDTQKGKKRLRKRRQPNNNEPTETVAGDEVETAHVGDNKALANPKTGIRRTSHAAQRIRNLSTPLPDSPSEQLTQGLQESTRRTVDRKAVDLNVKQPVVFNTKDEKSRTTKRSRKRKSNETTEESTIQPRVEAPDQDKGSTKDAIISAGKLRSSNAVSTNPELKIDQVTNARQEVEAPLPLESSSVVSADRSTLAVPPINRTIREGSTDSHVTSSSQRILPRGMTQEEFDRLMKVNAHLDSAEPEQPAKKNTSSLRQSSSAETSADKVKPQNTKSKATTSSATPRLPDPTEKTSGTPVSKEANKGTSKSLTGTQKKLAKSDAEQTGIVSTPAAKKSASSASTKTKTPSLAPSDSNKSEHTKAGSAKASTSNQVTKTAAGPGTKGTASIGTKQPTPTPSQSSKGTSSTSKKPVQKETVPNSVRSMLPPPPSSSSTTKVSAASATPTPKPRASGTASKAADPKRPIRPSGLPAYDSARSLTELRAMVNSAANSSASSPAPNTSRFTLPKKTLLQSNNDSDSDSASSSESDSSSSAPATTTANRPPKKPSTSDTGVKARPNPDPTIRDASDEDSDSETSDS